MSARAVYFPQFSSHLKRRISVLPPTGHTDLFFTPDLGRGLSAASLTCVVGQEEVKLGKYAFYFLVQTIA